MKILIKVTPEVLRAAIGCQKSTQDCVISRAVREFFPKACTLGHSIFIDKWRAGREMELRKEFRYIEMPDEAYQFTRLFDACMTSADVLALPLISFEVEVPSDIIDQIGIGEAYRILSESKTLELVHP